MQLNHLSLLQCPYCGSALTVDFTYPNRPEFATVHCDCDTYPIVDGIAYLKKGPQLLNQRAAEAIRAGNPHEALQILFLEERKLTRFLYSLLLRLPLSLRVFIRLWQVLVPGSKSWQNYLLRRDQRVSFIVSAATLAFTKDGEVITDLGCGAGHFLKKAMQLRPDSTLIGVDGSFSLLFLAKRFFLQKSTQTLLICTDLDAGIPLQDTVSDHTFCNDAFMYFHRKKHVAQEMRRTTTAKGRVYITHLHHRLAKNLGQGYGMSVQDATSLFPELRGYISSDRSLLHTLIQRQTLIYQQLSSYLKEEDFYNSFSLIWTKEKKSVIKLAVNSELYSVVMPSDIDYTEDEYIQHGLVAP